MFVILQKYDFSSKSQHSRQRPFRGTDVCDTAKVRFFKQITTPYQDRCKRGRMFVILQKYDFSSKSQPKLSAHSVPLWCLWYCKSTIFQANHNPGASIPQDLVDVCDTAKVRFFKQITTLPRCLFFTSMMFVILQKYDFPSKSQLLWMRFEHS